MNAAAQRPELVDIGVNLTHRRLAADGTEVVNRAHAAGVRTLVVTGTSLPASRAAAHLTVARHLYATAGVHPHNASTLSPTGMTDLEALLRQPGVVAVGECGLDFNRNFSEPRDQERALEMQLELAVAMKMPVFLHERDASEAFVRIVSRHRAGLAGGVVHCFTGTRQALRQYLDLDLHIGITGWVCDERRGAHLLEAVGDIPDNRLMLETDAPFLLPRTMPDPPRDRRNEPAFLPWVLRQVARARGVSEEELAQQTTKTARRFFRLDGSQDAETAGR